MRQGGKAWSRQDAVCCHPVCFQVGAVSESGACLECAYCKVLPKSQLDTNTIIRQIWVSSLQTALALICLSKWYPLNFVVPDSCLDFWRTWGMLISPRGAQPTQPSVPRRGTIKQQVQQCPFETIDESRWFMTFLDRVREIMGFGMTLPIPESKHWWFFRITSLSLSICPFTDLACCVDRVLSGEFCRFKSPIEVPIDEEDESEAPKSFGIQWRQLWKNWLWIRNWSHLSFWVVVWYSVFRIGIEHESKLSFSKQA